MSKNEAYEALTERIIQSSTFGHSNTYANLLRYLVTTSLDGDPPKESVIASEIFGMQNIASDNTKVRVYIYNLRKKIKKYYDSEGQQEQIILSIPKGSYAVEFKQKPTPKIAQGDRLRKILPSIGIAILTALLLLVIVRILSPGSSTMRKGIWTSYFDSQKQNALVIGDLFVFAEIDSLSGRGRTIREVNINSKGEFFEIKTPQQHTLPYSFLLRGSVEWVKNITTLFSDWQEVFSIQFMTELSPKDLLDQNIIYVGMLKNAGILRKYFANSHFTFDETKDPSTLVYTDESGKTIKFSPQGHAEDYHTDYGVIAKIPGPNNNEVFIIGGLWDTSTAQCLKNVTDPKLQANIEEALVQKFNELPQYFEILFEVSGINRTELSTKLLYAHRIKDDNSLWEVH